MTNLVDITKLLCYPHRRSTIVSLETFTLSVTCFLVVNYYRLVNCYFQVSFNLKAILYVPKVTQNNVTALFLKILMISK